MGPEPTRAQPKPAPQRSLAIAAAVPALIAALVVLIFTSTEAAKATDDTLPPGTRVASQPQPSDAPRVGQEVGRDMGTPSNAPEPDRNQPPPPGFETIPDYPPPLPGGQPVTGGSPSPIDRGGVQTGSTSVDHPGGSGPSNLGTLPAPQGNTSSCEGCGGADQTIHTSSGGVGKGVLYALSAIAMTAGLALLAAGRWGGQHAGQGRHSEA